MSTISKNNDLEEAILKFWSTKDDLELLYENVESLNIDDIQNTLLGLIRLHEMRSQKLHDMYKKQTRG